MAVTTDPNAVFYSYRGVGTNQVVKKFIDLLDEKGIPHRGSESEPIEGALTDFEEKIGAANIIVIFYSQEYFESEHCMNEYANIRKYENEARKAATFCVKCGDFKFEDITETLEDCYGIKWAKFKDKNKDTLKPINRRTVDNGYYLDTNTTYCIQKLDNYFSKTARYKEDSLPTLVGLICDKYRELSSKNTPVIQEIPIVSAPHFTLSVPDGLMQREDEEGNLFNLISKNRIVNLVGVGGSGKSSLAYLCLNRHKNDFNEISFVVVNNNIKDDIVDQLNKTLKLEFEEDAYTKIITFLQENYQSDKPNLLALDINETADKDKTTEYINEILQDTAYLAGWKILILSRENVDTHNRIKTHNLNDKEDFDFLKKLFLEKAGARYSEFSDFAGLFNVIYYNPLLAEQLGWYLNSYPKTVTLDDIKKILYGSLGKQEMQGMSAAQRHDENVNTFLKNLIVYDNLEENEQKLLRHFVLWQSEYIEYDLIADLLKGVFESEDELINTLTSLSKRSILTTNNEDTLSYKLHGLLANSLREQIDIENEDYEVYLDNIKRIIKYSYYKFVPFVDCVEKSLCEYDIIANDFYLLSKVGTKFYDTWKTDYANKTFNKYIKIISERIDRNPNSIEEKYCLAKGYNKLANLQANRLHCYASAKENYEKAINIGVKLPKNNSEYQDVLAWLYNNLAMIQSDHLQDMHTAKENYETAIAIRKQLQKDNPESKYKNSLARVYDTYACFQENHLLNYYSAKENYQKAIDIREPLKDNPEYQNNLVKAYNNLANLQQNHLNEYDFAEVNYKKAIKVGDNLPKDNPEYQNNRANSYINLANLQISHLKDYASAETNYKTAIEIGEKLPKVNPIFQNTLAGAYNGLANTYDKLKDYDKAIESINTAIDIAFQLKEQDSKYLIYWTNYRYSLAEIKFNNGKDLDEVKNILAEIKPLAQQCLKDNPDDEWTKTVNDDIDDLLSKVEKSIS
ncbi:MAG: tetratricopeptide repeat protein [Bacteroidales bacterium]|nr:tetratricopeptide repeat protein [Bacteroidales bacterium]